VEGLFISSLLFARKASLVVHYIRTLLACGGVAFPVFGLASYQGPDLGVLALSVELLQFRSQAGALGVGDGGRENGMTSDGSILLCYN
jgi:hypothetical protein